MDTPTDTSIAPPPWLTRLLDEADAGRRAECAGRELDGEQARTAFTLRQLGYAFNLRRWNRGLLLTIRPRRQVDPRTMRG
jgi:hypothetical protein